MEKPVQWMTVQELRDELAHTRPAWETTDLDGCIGILPTEGRRRGENEWEELIWFALHD
jgi:hypothetical protein